MPERRHRFRAQSDRRVSWKPAGTDAHWEEAALIDVSTGGARMRSEKAPVHHHLTLVLRLGDDQRMTVQAELLRIESQLPSGEFAWAVAFIALPTDAQAHLTRFVFREAKSLASAS